MTPSLSVLMSAKITTEIQFRWMVDAVESIRRQTYQDFEFVIVDDESTIDISCFNTIRHDKSTGLADALNFGLVYCSGELVLRMDADDIARPTLIAKQAEFFQKYPQAVACGVQLKAFHYQTGENCTLGGGFPTHHPERITPELAQELGKKGQFWWVNHPGITFRKDVVLEMGGYQEGQTKDGTPVREMEDMKLWLKMSKAGYTFYNLPDILIDYRYRPPVNRRSKEYYEAHKNETNKFLER